MAMTNSVKRISAGAAALLGGAVLVATAGATAASAAEPGVVELCAQGDYATYVEFQPFGDGGAGMASTVQEPGQCWKQEAGPAGGSTAVDVWGLRADGSTFHVGSATYDTADGIGLGAKGSESAPSLAKW
ncbi:hypothetical protein OOZ19_02480 [Saccharopolyspora sp. NFXS83]|uniref:hypothetical protein n=1 Tax=Saccharopolyspora sp. NFXS83 TaxID=2993560 RepID=UPI00224AA8D3|nr:hypothetical protein [Saccharopolyspora sp. NFXS83]MCX2729097.1 hypothetical protein [Saccharopolyspora sp. NFXS83]